jgi:hypothetical protein
LKHRGKEVSEKNNFMSLPIWMLRRLMVHWKKQSLKSSSASSVPLCFKILF